ncbi:methyltransferase [Microtetraspora sp. NBRC 13810]|uniref:methyltransferase n=1 Tax=Microtetraspora sp. NBRC 13810 TaxID=3030990 RepID=UPI0024A4981B|nr:methyltransferase [Microtetraspora sp. NBRC 13810]GLW09224.1 methyltransferase [Microtetraspora sp. NBRC 13810]
MTVTTPPPGPAGPIHDLTVNVWRFAAVRAFVELGCADHLAGGPLPLAELARRCGADAWALERLLRVLTPLEIVDAVDGDGYALGGSAHALRDADDSLRWMVLIQGDPVWWDALRRLPDTVRTGRPEIHGGYGTPWEYLAGAPEADDRFQRFMTARTLRISAAVAESVDDGHTVVDVGGGRGTLLAAVLRARPGCRGVLLDLPHEAAGARAYLAGREVAGRCEVVAGDFFGEVPGGGDVYLLASVLHDWGPAEARKILDNVRAAMAPGARLLCADILLREDRRAPHPSNELGLRIMSLHPGGRERTLAEYEALLAGSGLRLTGVADLPDGFSLVSAVPGEAADGG